MLLKYKSKITFDQSPDFEKSYKSILKIYINALSFNLTTDFFQDKGDDFYGFARMRSQKQKDLCRFF